MSFATDLFDLLHRAALIEPPPSIAALHLPPAPPPGSTRGEFCAVELADGSIGSSYVLFDDTLARLRARDPMLGLQGAATLTVASAYCSRGSGPEATLGFAAANALTRWIFGRCGFVPPDSHDSIGQLHPGPGDRVGMIGLFEPLIPAILASGAELVVVERDERLVSMGEGYRVSLDPKELERCSLVLSTGTLMLNGTLDDMLLRCRQARAIALIGPSVGCLPDALFSRGVSFLGGAWIEDAPGYLAALEKGQRRTKTTRKFALTPNTYPGLDRLLARWGRLDPP